jgi:hypothetical protein
LAPLDALILGGLISLISAVVGIILQHFLSIRKMLHETKIHPSHVLYQKQIEFLDALSLLFDQINGYITTIDVWVGDRGARAKVEVEKARKKKWKGDVVESLYFRICNLPKFDNRYLLIRLGKLTFSTTSLFPYPGLC